MARDLVGAILSHRLPDGRLLRGRLVEVEAYLGDGSDPASHSHGGPTRRNNTMFGPPGRLYAYRSYGIHTCANVVCGPPGLGEAVLFRALEPMHGLAAMRELRGRGPHEALEKLACGPGRLGQAMGFTLDHDGTSLLRGPISLHAPPRGTPRGTATAGPRVGITRGAALPLRFLEAESPWASSYRPGRRRQAPAGVERA